MFTFCLKHVFPQPTFRETVNMRNTSWIGGMFEASLKFQATEKQADKRQSWARKCSGSLYKGPALPWILRCKHGKKWLAKLGSEREFSVLFKARRTYHPRLSSSTILSQEGSSRAGAPHENPSALNLSIIILSPSWCRSTRRRHSPFLQPKRSQMLLSTEPTLGPELQINFYPHNRYKWKTS